MERNFMKKIINNLSSGKRRGARYWALCSIGAAAVFGMACALILSAAAIPKSRKAAVLEVAEKGGSFEVQVGGFLTTFNVGGTDNLRLADKWNEEQLLFATVDEPVIPSPEENDVENNGEENSEVKFDVTEVTEGERYEAFRAQITGDAGELMPMQVMQVTASKDGVPVDMAGCNITMDVMPTEELIDKASKKLGVSVKVLTSDGNVTEETYTNAQISGGELAPIAVTFTVPEDGTAMYAIIFDETDTWELTGDVTDLVYMEVPADANWTIDLKGHTIEKNHVHNVDAGEFIVENEWGVYNFSLFDVKGTLTIMDSVGGGSIIAHNKQEEKYGKRDEDDEHDEHGVQFQLFYVRGGGTLNICGGTLEAREENTRVVNAEEEVRTIVNMSGGTVTGGKGTWAGGGIFVAEGEINISGGKIWKNQAGEGGGIYAAVGTVVNISGNCEITENYATPPTKNGYGGGVRSLDKINMSGGEIYKNVSDFDGGGVSVNDHGFWGAPTEASMVMTGGKIYENRAGIDNAESTNAGGGGGVSAKKLEMSGGEIYKNTTWFNGGGVYAENMKMTGGEISSNEVLKGNIQLRGGGGIFIDEGEMSYPLSGETTDTVCNMSITGGTISDNGSYHTGGGIFVNTGAVAYICGKDRAVEIRGNKAEDDFYYNPEGEKKGHGFAGGGIFVEHPLAPNSGADATEGGHVYIYNAVITENTALFGGGIAGCGTSETTICSIDGVAVYGNNVGETEPSKDLYVDGKATVDSMLMGGVQATWKGNWRKVSVDPDTGEKTETIIKDFSLSMGKRTFDTGCYLGIEGLDNEKKATIRRYATVFIEGNESGSGGGGIGGNGFMKLGLRSPDPENTYTLTLKKIVSGAENSDEHQSFSFSIKLTDSNNQPLKNSCPYTLNGTTATEELTVDQTTGIWEHELRNEDCIIISALPLGTRYTITETPTDGYAPSFEVIKGDVTNDNTANNVVIGWIAQDNSIVFTNTALYALPETGGETPAMYYLLGCALLITASAGGWIYRKRSKSI